MTVSHFLFVCDQTHTIDLVLVSMGVHLNASASEWAYYLADTIVPFVASIQARQRLSITTASSSPLSPSSVAGDQKQSLPSDPVLAGAQLSPISSGSPRVTVFLSVKLVGLQIAFTPEHDRAVPLITFRFKYCTATAPAPLLFHSLTSVCLRCQGAVLQFGAAGHY